MEDWLKKRISPNKNKVARWNDMSEALQEYWEEYSDLGIQELSDLRNIFTSSPENLEKTMRELGDYFRADIGDDNDWPIQIAWRRLELQAKEMDSTIQRVLKRKFLGLDIQWTVLYAHKTDEYGTNFKTLSEIQNQGLNQAEFFLSSRGKVSIVSPEWDSSETPFNGLITAIGEEAERILPTHIYYMGTSILAEALVLYLYWGGVAVEWKKSGLNMDEHIYPPKIVLSVGGGAQIGAIVTIYQDAYMEYDYVVSDYVEGD